MIELIIRLFVKNSGDTEDPAVRRAYGTVSGIVGVVLNVLLFAVKYFAGAISGSIAVISDAFNNLSDAGSSVITLLGFKLSGAKPDREHPYGHGRMEYISGFVVSLLILLMGLELGKASIEKIIHPETVEHGTVSLIILSVAIAVKLYMFIYNRRIAKKIKSQAVMATAIDSISDAAATAAVLVSALIMKYRGIALDGWCGVLVALLILRGGIAAAKETIDPLLGHGPSPELVESIKNIVMAHEEIIGIHDLVVHDYGPGRRMVSLHGEVAGNGDLMQLHDAIDGIERELCEKLGCEAVIHMDPIAVDDERAMEITRTVKELAKSVDARLTVHDLRLVTGPTHTNIIFDVVMPQDAEIGEKELRETLSRMISEAYPNSYAVITVDRSYV